MRLYERYESHFYINIKNMGMLKRNDELSTTLLTQEIYNMSTYVSDANIVIVATSCFENDKYYLLFRFTTGNADNEFYITICLGETKVGRYRFSFVQLAEMSHVFQKCICK